MSKKFAHQRNHARDAVRVSIGKHGIDGKATSYDSSVVDFGKYKRLKKTPAELIIFDPGYFFWCLSNDVFHGWKLVKAKGIRLKARHFLPPKPGPKVWFFLLAFNPRIN